LSTNSVTTSNQVAIIMRTCYFLVEESLHISVSYSLLMLCYSVEISSCLLVHSVASFQAQLEFSISRVLASCSLTSFLPLISQFHSLCQLLHNLMELSASWI
jgi:hypothetical protein